MKSEERATVIEECAKECERLAREWRQADAITSAYAAQDCADVIRGLTAQSPAGVPPEPDDYNSTIDWQGETPSAGVPTIEDEK
jgi:hypothetical protein